ncbi:TVP38/TMEM64 family protein [Brevibacillus fluminis]|uniref:TVP38/TMEM64 family membrane protein n=1 Tax=Brevibacillus fluminis TaxID=511487 RepID=A0A3M8DYG0_9BACL|nr:VTT domain-containing protein [Brevibacillus fluminis]RNB92017.1 TVP38/TMEM64 family protein [Brevibacillus fluminis]
MKKWLLLAGYLIILLAAFGNLNKITAWLKTGDVHLLPYMFVAAIFLGLFPVFPYGVFAGMMGAKYGAAMGALINWTGGFGSAVLLFLFVRYGYQKSGQKMLARYPKVDEFTDLFEANAFLAILFARLIPVVPSPVVTIYSAISSVRTVSFTIATALGKIPTILLFTFVGDQLFHNLYLTIVTLVSYGCFVGIVYIIYRRWQARHQKKSLL